MFILYADKTRVTVRRSEPLTSGSVNVYHCRFEFSPEWEELAKTACFRSGSRTVTVLLDSTGECVIPWEVTDPDDKGKRLYAGVCGVRDGGTVLPTVWADLGEILPGVTCCGGPSRPPVPGQYEQVLSGLEKKQDKLRGEPGQVVGFDETGSAVPVDLPSGDEEGTSGEGGAGYKLGHGLKQEGDTISVDMASAENPDKTLPVSASAVENTVGNIEILLKTI